MSTWGTEPAYPVINGIPEWQRGLTKREYFAAIALQGILSDHTISLSQSIATDAVKMADHLLKALNEK